MKFIYNILSFGDNKYINKYTLKGINRVIINYNCQYYIVAIEFLDLISILIKLIK